MIALLALLTAIEARQVADKVNAESRIAPILERIEEASDAGRYSYSIMGKCADAGWDLPRLKKLGYKVRDTEYVDEATWCNTTDGNGVTATGPCPPERKVKRALCEISWGKK